MFTFLTRLAKMRQNLMQLKNAQKFAAKKESVQELPRTGLAYNNLFLFVHRRNETISVKDGI